MLRALTLSTLPVLAACSTAPQSVPQTVPQMRMTPDELSADSASTNQIGSSHLAGVHTKVLAGDPAKPGFYTILLFVPHDTTIQAHSHRDDRVATVVSGQWHFGYGDHFDPAALKALPPGSVYSEPGGMEHFAQTASDSVVVEISGYGPTDTVYFDRANDPTKHD
jgi:uncharacterized RmlC-like cupin family protein